MAAPAADDAAADSPGGRARFRRILLAGLLILAPLALTAFVLVQVFRWMERHLRAADRPRAGAGAAASRTSTSPASACC